MLLKSLSLSRIVRSASAPPNPFFMRAPIFLHTPSGRLKPGPCSTRGPGSSQRGAPPPGNLRERLPLRARLDPPSHSTALSSAPRSLQGDLTLWTPTFLGEGKREGSRQKGRAKRVVGPEGVLPGVRTLQVPAAGAGSRKGCGTGLPWLAERAPSKHGARVRSGRAGLGRAGV